MGASVNILEVLIDNLSIGDSWRTNIQIGSKIKLYNSDSIYIFYGYNYDKTIICCFPINANNILELSKYVSITEIDKVF
jgi:hypothetical protein